MIANLYVGHDLSFWERAGRRGERPGLGPYGVEHLARQDVTLTHWNGHDGRVCPAYVSTEGLSALFDFHLCVPPSHADRFVVRM